MKNYHKKIKYVDKNYFPVYWVIQESVEEKKYFAFKLGWLGLTFMGAKIYYTSNHIICLDFVWIAT